MDNGRKTARVTENLPQCQFIHHQAYMNYPGIELGPSQWQVYAPDRASLNNPRNKYLGLMLTDARLALKTLQGEHNLSQIAGSERMKQTWGFPFDDPWNANQSVHSKTGGLLHCLPELDYCKPLFWKSYKWQNVFCGYFVSNLTSRSGINLLKKNGLHIMISIKM